MDELRPSKKGWVAKQREMEDLAKKDVWLSKEKRVKSKKKMGGQLTARLLDTTFLWIRI